jgi:hypothetical protein
LTAMQMTILATCVLGVWFKTRSNFFFLRVAKTRNKAITLHGFEKDY